MKFFYYDHYDFPLPDSHRFPKEKYTLLRESLLQQAIIERESMISAPRATKSQLLLGHSEAYIDQVQQLALPRKAERELGLPLTHELSRRVEHTVGATIEACMTALDEGIAATGGGGTHHAQWAWPQGYCIYNDAIIAARILQQRRLASEVLIVDCDVHQGNGTALIAQNDPSIFTFSIHCQQNFPARKAESDLDLPLPAGTGNSQYLDVLEAGLNKILTLFKPEFVIYLAGADPHENDRLGKLSLTFSGLSERDQLVFKQFTRRGIPLAVTLAGGYGKDIRETVSIYAQTLKIAAAEKAEL